MISLIKSHWKPSKFSFHETLAVRKQRQWAEMDPSLIFCDEEILREAALSAEDPTWDGSAALGRPKSFFGKKFVNYLKWGCVSALGLFSPYSQQWLWWRGRRQLLCVRWYFLSAVPQVGYLHPELSIRFKATDIKMINLASQRQAPIMPDHFLCPLLTLNLRFMQMHHYEPFVRRRDNGATVPECVFQTTMLLRGNGWKMRRDRISRRKKRKSVEGDGCVKSGCVTIKSEHYSWIPFSTMGTVHNYIPPSSLFTLHVTRESTPLRVHSI